MQSTLTCLRRFSFSETNNCHYSLTTLCQSRLSSFYHSRLRNHGRLSAGEMCKPRDNHLLLGQVWYKMFSTLFFHCPSPRPSIKVHIWGNSILTALQLFPRVVFALWRSVRHWQKTKTWREDEWEVYPLFIPSPPPLLGEIKEKLALSLFYYLSPWLNHPPTHHTVLLPSSLAYHPLSTSCLSVCVTQKKFKGCCICV